MNERNERVDRERNNENGGLTKVSNCKNLNQK